MSTTPTDAADAAANTSDTAPCRLWPVWEAGVRGCVDLSARISQESLVHSYSAPNAELQHQKASGSLNAVLYVSIVMMFYVAMVLLLVGVNLYRRRHAACHARRPLLVYDGRSDDVTQQLLSCKQSPAGDSV